MPETEFDPRAFDSWYRAVCAACADKCGLSADDLPDCCYAEWYEDGYTPEEAAAEAIASAAAYE